MTPKNLLFSGLLVVMGVLSAVGQSSAPAHIDTAYNRVVTERAAKIVATLNLSEPAKSARVQESIARQYRDLNTIRERRKEAIKNRIETTPTATKLAEKEKLEGEITGELKILHTEFLTRLAADLNGQQIDQVKDGMTYGVLPITYKGYQAMLPDLTEAQKKQILAWLTEARERAMDEGTSKEKHAMFGKYKGRINNYLSAAGIDLKQAGKAWEERIASEAEKARKQ
ncbi:DUF3826 domain-containing protein [Larkinella humicola]|uniref:DUF3826 domain-containing protein n=1 Tax=Larkinella humicola TaxID=2607654 RepID=A0A5N1J5G5_9BACT|nr:DUF3826 domain-containing protein [Larkinella humicola]KAA9345443.1 DUF3826 domain-containing protein [Larkinella humicola]